MRHLYDISPDGGLILHAVTANHPIESLFGLVVGGLVIVILASGIIAAALAEKFLPFAVAVVVAAGIGWVGTLLPQNVIIEKEQAKAEAARAVSVSEFRAWASDRYGLTIGEKAAAKLIDGKKTFVVGSGELRTSRSADDEGLYLVVGTSDRELLPVHVTE